jgi:hypothetical protein
MRSPRTRSCCVSPSGHMFPPASPIDAGMPKLQRQKDRNHSISLTPGITELGPDPSGRTSVAPHCHRWRSYMAPLHSAGLGQSFRSKNGGLRGHVPVTFFLFWNRWVGRSLGNPFFFAIRKEKPRPLKSARGNGLFNFSKTQSSTCQHSKISTVLTGA